MRGTRGSSKETHSQNFPTIFVDHLPHQIRKIWLYNVFCRYGKIREIFIPNKRSKVKGQSLGFVRFYRRQEAALAVADSNNSRCWGFRLVVKFARFFKNEDKQGFCGNTHGGHAIRSVTTKQNPPIERGRSVEKERYGGIK